MPFWVKDIKVGFSNVNAKAEGIEGRSAPLFWQRLVNAGNPGCRGGPQVISRGRDDVRARSGQRWATNREACRRSGVVGCDITGPPPNRCSRPKQLVCCARDGRLWARGSQASRMRDQTALNAHCVHEAVGSIRLSICSGLSGALLAPEPSEAFEWESGGSLRGIGHDRRLAEP